MLRNFIHIILAFTLSTSLFGAGESAVYVNPSTGAITRPITAAEFRNSNGVVGTSDSQTLTNKTINGANNTLTVRLANDVSGTLPVSNGGTGQTSYTDGQLLIGNSSGNTLAKATLTGTANQVTVTNGSGTITLSLPQSIGTGNSPSWSAVTLSAAVDYTAPPSATTALNQNLADQVWADELVYEWVPNMTYAVHAEAGTGGQLLSGVGGQIWLKTGTDASSRSSWAYQIAQQLAFPGVDDFGEASFQKPMWASFKFQFQQPISTNGVFRCTVGHQSTNGALSVRGFGFSVTYNAANVGDIKAFAHDGSSLTTSAALGTVATNNSTVHTVTLASNGLGTIAVFLDGVYLGNVTGGPTSVGAGGNVVQEVINGADTSENAVLVTSIRSRVKKN